MHGQAAVIVQDIEALPAGAADIKVNDELIDLVLRQRERPTPPRTCSACWVVSVLARIEYRLGDWTVPSFPLLSCVVASNEDLSSGAKRRSVR